MVTAMHRLWQLLLAEFVCRGDDIFVVHFLAIASYAAFVAFTWCGHEVRNVVRTSGGDVCVCFTDRRLPDPWYLVLYFWRRISALVPIFFYLFHFLATVSFAAFSLLRAMVGRLAFSDGVPEHYGAVSLVHAVR